MAVSEGEREIGEQGTGEGTLGFRGGTGLGVRGGHGEGASPWRGWAGSGVPAAWCPRVPLSPCRGVPVPRVPLSRCPRVLLALYCGVPMSLVLPRPVVPVSRCPLPPPSVPRSRAGSGLPMPVIVVPGPHRSVTRLVLSLRGAAGSMAGRKAAIKAIDWAAFAERVPPSQRAMFNALKTRSDALSAR